MMKLLTKYLIYYPLFWAGYILFRITNKTFIYSYESFRRLYFLTNGQLNDWLSQKIATKNPPYIIKNKNGILNSYSDDQLNAIVNDIEKDGYHVFDQKLNDQTIAKITEYASNLPTIPIPDLGNYKKIVFDRENLVAPRYDFEEIQIIKSAEIQKLFSDVGIIDVAQRYLKCKPIQDLLAMWWSAPFKSNEEKVRSKAAQLYHFDMDRIKFIKFFFYLSDVNTHNGPHCYIKSSHKNIPKSLRRDGRFSDKEIFSEYPENNLVEITGQKGSILAVDTRGFHKGKPVEQGERLLLLIEFTNSLFGKTYNKIDLRNIISNETRETLAQFPHTYQRFQF